MTPADFRSLIAVGGLSNREAAEALGVADERLIRRLKSGDEEASPEIAAVAIEIVAEALAAQLLRSINLAAGGRVGLARLTVAESAIQVETALSARIARRVREEVLTRLKNAGLSIERDVS